MLKLLKYCPLVLVLHNYNGRYLHSWYTCNSAMHFVRLGWWLTSRRSESFVRCSGPWLRGSFRVLFQGWCGGIRNDGRGLATTLPLCLLGEGRGQSLEYDLGYGQVHALLNPHLVCNAAQVSMKLKHLFTIASRRWDIGYVLSQGFQTLCDDNRHVTNISITVQCQENRALAIRRGNLTSVLCFLLLAFIIMMWSIQQWRITLS